jgi:hypothetical protein
MLHACIYTICLVFRYTSWHFYAFSRTNLLTRCHSASSLFFCYFCVSEKLHSKYSWNWTKQKPNIQILNEVSGRPKRRRSRARGWSHHQGARPRPWPWCPMVRPPWSTSVGISLSGKVPGRASGPSRSRVNDDGGSRCVSGKLIGYLDFSHRGVFIGERAVSEVDQGSLTHRGRDQGLGHATIWWAWLLAPLCLIFGLREALVKIGGSAFVSSNSENISCITFLKHKNSRK